MGNRVEHSRKHDIADSNDHKGDIYNGLVHATNPISLANPAAEHQYVQDQILAHLKGLDWQESVLDICAVGAAVQVTGNRYIASATGGGWTIDHIYEWSGSAWIDTTPNEGYTLEAEDENEFYTYTGTAWVHLGSMVDIPFYGLYYVSETGSDSTGTGSISKPWKTYQHAHDVTSGMIWIMILDPQNIADQPLSVTGGRGVGIFNPVGVGPYSAGELTTLTMGINSSFVSYGIQVITSITGPGSGWADVYFASGGLLATTYTTIGNCIFWFNETVITEAAWAALKAGTPTIHGIAYVREFITLANQTKTGGIDMSGGEIKEIGNISSQDPGTSADSFYLQLSADNSGTLQHSRLITCYGANPYLRIMVPHETGGAATALLDLHRTLVAPTNTGACDLGSSGNKFKDLHLSGNINVDGNVDGKDVSSLIANVVEDTTPQLGGALDINQKSIDYPALSVNLTWQGNQKTLTAGAGTVWGNVCMMQSDGKMDPADASAVATANGLLAFATATLADTETGKYILNNTEIRDDSWSWTPGLPLFLSETTGALTQTAPVLSGAVVRVLGHAITATTIWWNPDNTWVVVP